MSEPFVFATRKSELRFWTKLADAIFDGYPYYHLKTRQFGACTVCYGIAMNLGAFAEDKIIQLMEKPP